MNHAKYIGSMFTSIDLPSCGHSTDKPAVEAIRETMLPLHVLWHPHRS